MAQQEKNFKIWKATKDSKAALQLTPNEAYLIGNKGNFVVAHENGVSINAKSLALNMPSDQIRNGGFFIKMNDITQLIPTTLVTPMPAQIPFPPLGLALGMIVSMAFIVAIMDK